MLKYPWALVVLSCRFRNNNFTPKARFLHPQFGVGIDHNKDFLAFTEHNPTDYLWLRRRFGADHPEHALDVGPLPTD